MKVLYNWLNEFVPLDMPPEEAGRILTLLGLEVSQIEPLGMDVHGKDAPLGRDVRDTLGLRDTLLEVEVTPNRPDCLSHIGIARELAAALKRPLKLPEIHLRELPGPDQIPIAIRDVKGCPRYLARLIRDVRVASSPLWMVQRLLSCGLRPINNVVDITNYVLLEVGHPLHAFDLTSLVGPELIVRRAKSGETLKTLDHQECPLDDTMLVIADGNRPVALAGILGGVDTAVASTTQELVLESAVFDPPLIRRTARRLGISTESSYRFERGVGWDGASWASQRAAALLQELTGGKVSKVKEVAPQPRTPVVLDLRLKRAQQVLGMPLDSAVAADGLRHLQFTIEPSRSAETLRITVPSHRVDITQEVDVLEELARVMGYQEIPTRSPRFPTLDVAVPLLWRLEGLCREILVGLGLFEAVTYSFVNQAQATPFLPPQVITAALARPLNPLSDEWAVLRPSLLPGLLSVILMNLRRQARGCHLFELGRVFWKDQAQVTEGRRVAWVVAGDRERHWTGPGRSPDLYTLTGMAHHLLLALRIPQGRWGPVSVPWLHPAQSAQLEVNGTMLGFIGQMHPGLMTLWESPVPLWLAEFDLEGMARNLPQPSPLTPPSRFPAVVRDLAILVDDAVSYEQVQQVLHTAAGTILEHVVLFDVYRGAQVEPGKKSLALTVTLRHPGRTLTDQEVEHLFDHLIEALRRQLGAFPRGPDPMGGQGG